MRENPGCLLDLALNSLLNRVAGHDEACGEAVGFFLNGTSAAARAMGTSRFSNLHHLACGELAGDKQPVGVHASGVCNL